MPRRSGRRTVNPGPPWAIGATARVSAVEALSEGSPTTPSPGSEGELAVRPLWFMAADRPDDITNSMGVRALTTA